MTDDETAAAKGAVKAAGRENKTAVMLDMVEGMKWEVPTELSTADQ